LQVEREHDARRRDAPTDEIGRHAVLGAVSLDDHVVTADVDMDEARVDAALL
jgi:hypothetical protein